MLALFNQYEQPVTVTIQLLKQLHVKVTNTKVNETILNHPDYPSILSISDALNGWHVENAAIRIENDKLAELPLPFIAFTKISGGSFVLVTEIKDDKVFYQNENNKIKSKSLEKFLQEFNSIVLLSQANENSGEVDFKNVKRKENISQLKIPAFIIVGVLLMVAATSPLTPLHGWRGEASLNILTGFIILMVLKFLGILVTAVLLWYEADKANPALQKICSGGGKTNCNAILNSKEAKLFNWLSWSEIGFFYFAGGFLFVIANAVKQSPATTLSTFQLIQLLNLFALPYVFFSIYYQWRIAKQWCPLCLTVQAILVLEFIAAIGFYKLNFVRSFQHINLSTVSTFFIAFTLPMITWLIIKPLLHNQQKGTQDFRSLQRIKFNTDIFNALLQKQKHLEVSPDELGITLGNKNATNTLIKVCNPYCGPCAKAHPEIEKLLEENNNLKVQIIFAATSDESDLRALPARHLLAIAESKNEAITKKALDDWYLPERKDYNLFAVKYPMNGELKMQNKKIDAMKKWCDKVDIHFTPTIFYNSYQLPDAYNIGDLKYFLVE